MKSLFLAILASISLVVATELDMTHDAFINTTWGHLNAEQADLASTLKQLDQLQLQAQELILENVKTKVDQSNLASCLTQFINGQKAFLQASSDHLSDSDRVLLDKEITAILLLALKTAKPIIPESTDIDTLTSMVSAHSCLTRLSATDALGYFENLITVSTDRIQNLGQLMETQRANLGILARKTDFTQKQAANHIDSITLTLASLKEHVQADA